MNLTFLVLASIFFGVIPMFSNAAFEVSPVIMTVSPSGPDASVSVSAVNTGESKTPIQISIFRREPDQDGKENYIDSKEINDMFQIVPSQFILDPKEKRTVRITYVGDQKLVSELAFRVISEEFPINVTDPSKVKNKAVASISIVSKYVSSLYVKPRDAEPKLEITATETSDKKMQLIFKNAGTTHKILKDVTYIAQTPEKKEFTFPIDAERAIGTQNILAGKSRKFIIPWPREIPFVALKITAVDTKTLKK